MITFERLKLFITGDNCTTGCLLDYPYFNEHYKMIEIDLSKQKALDENRKAIHQINFSGNLELMGCATMCFIIEENKRSCFGFFTRNQKIVISLFCFNLASI